jgi:hypothetical protein
MTRSQTQIAMSYAPGQHFTFEGAAGACLAVPSRDATFARINPTTRVQIEMRIDEAAKAWFDKALNCRKAAIDSGNPMAPPVPDACVDVSLLDTTRRQYSFRPHVFAYFRPDRMGYIPQPTTLICSQCGLIEPTNSPRHMGQRLGELAERCPHPSLPDDPSSCSWGQLDVIFVHWSGSWKSASPNMTVYDQAMRRPVKRYATCGKCAGRQFVLNKDQVALSNWTFSCANCGARHPDPWIDKCDETLTRIAGTIGAGNIVGEASMEKINYAASSAYFVRSDTFIAFPEGSGIEALEPGQAHLLPHIVEQIVGLPGAPLSDADIDKQLDNHHRSSERAEFANIQSGIAMARASNNTAVEEWMAGTKAQKIAEWTRAGWIVQSTTLPRIILDKLQRRDEWSPRYDPFRLMIEHAALAKTKLRGELISGRASFVDFILPDEWLVEPNTPEHDSMTVITRRAMDHLGIVRVGLITKFDLCKFSYGYTRIESQPSVMRHDRQMPVRLNLFPTVEAGGDHKHPVYVLEQSNEAYYFELDQSLVREWLAQPAIGCSDLTLLSSYPDNFAAAMLASSEVMRGYLEEHERKRPPTVYALTYTLLHSYAHHAMHAIAHFSGLDLGSMGEYLFPCDLAFVIYRNGMTLDLGDMSALWRNHYEAFLSYLRNYPTSLGCNLGNLCMTKGGACPDCIMIPEVSCLTSNKYLSRSTLIGRGRPHFIFGEDRIDGYLRLALENGRRKHS